MLDLVLPKTEVLLGNVEGILGCSGHEAVELKILRDVRSSLNKLTTLYIRRADCGIKSCKEERYKREIMGGLEQLCREYRLRVVHPGEQKALGILSSSLPVPKWY